MSQSAVRLAVSPVLALCVLLAAAPVGGADVPSVRALTILHTNDLHGHLLPFSYPDVEDETSPIAKMEATRDIGGAARIATLVSRIRAEEPDRVLLLDAGDVLDGTPFSVYHRGKADVAAMNAIGYDAMVAGNHEFNVTFEELVDLVETAAFPILCANARILEGDPDLFADPLLIERDGIRIGLFGVTTPASAAYPACVDRIEILDPIETARGMIPRLRKQGAELVLALTHLGASGDRELAEAVPEIDVIVGGHSHTRVEEPILVRPPGAERPVRIVHAFQWGGELGRLDLAIEAAGPGRAVVSTAHRSLLPVTSALREDPDVAALVERFLEPMLPIYGVRIGEAAGDFANVGFERATVNLVADAMRAASGAEIALQNYGGVRESIFSGPIRMWEIASMLPFDNRIVVVEMSGARLREVLASEREFLGFSGLEVVWRDHDPIQVRHEGEEIRDDRIYRVATNDYIHDKMFGDLPIVAETEELQRETVAAFIRAEGTISPVRDGRTRLAGD
ncbi:MAG: hypothetical protein GF346_11735 [Candidatus Eisenbacteria bacterium]|nr:hypothetical protein [Candidatus Latescibacterota bacterium]MBD3303107.1 hypothetical protein [Candidatus Eisenbacteria bacterium]